jgi:hypothetical protein
MTKLPDYSQFQEEASVDQLRSITEAVDTYLELQVAAAKAEADFAEASKKVRHYEEHLIPEAMRVANLKEFTTSSGYKVKLKSDVRASIPVARQDEAFAWLEANGQGGLIKRTVEISFAMGEDEVAKELQDELRERELSVNARRKVEPSSLKALLRRLLEKPENKVPMDIFGASEYDKAEVKSPKQK